MIDLAVQQGRFLDKRRAQLAAQRRRYDAVQSLQLATDEINAKLLSSGLTDLPASDPLKIKQAELAAALPAIQSAAENADSGIRSLLAELHAEGKIEELIAQLPGDIPILLFPVRLETRFCQIRHVAKPAGKNFLLDFSNVITDAAQINILRRWGVNRLGVAGAEYLQVRAPFPPTQSLNQNDFNTRIRQAIQTGNLKPANGKWLERKSDEFELRIRILPDDIHIDSFEESLTPQELERGRQFWRRVWKGDKPEDAWAELRSFFSTPRSAWCVRQTRPRNFVIGSEPPLAGQPEFSEPPLRANSYTQPPSAICLPDFFVATLSQAGQPDRVIKGNLIAKEILTGFDPNEPDQTSFQPDDNGDLKFPEALRWVFDFDEAEKIGMAIRVSLNRGEFRSGFDKLVVLGVKLSAGKVEGKELLERLFQNQIYQEDGMYVVPQGTPTNNFGSAKSGYNWPEQEAARYFKATFNDGHVWSDEQRTNPFSQPDGLRLIQALGIDEEYSRRLPGADIEDAREALAMNRLLFPGTFGYYLRQFFSPPLMESHVDALQLFFEQFVTGRGLLPAIRAGHQPYGLLTTTAFKFWKPKNLLEFSQHVFDNLKKLDVFWDGVKSKVLFAGDGQVPPNQLSEDLMRLAGTDPGSSLYAQQAIFGEGYLNLLLRLHNFQFLGLPPSGAVGAPPAVNEFAARIEPELRGKLFDPANFSAFRFVHLYTKQRKLDGPLIEQLPSSETGSLQPFSGSEWNYLDWLLHSSIEDFWKERFQNVPRAAESAVPVPPKALLYHFARFALRRGALEGALRLLEPGVKRERLRMLKTKDLEFLSLLPDDGSELTPETLRDTILLDHSLKPLVQALGLTDKFFLKPNRFSFFEQTIGEPGRPVKDALQQGAVPGAETFAKQRQALLVLRGLPTARLERLLSEHLDLCSYRLDAWFNALVLERLNRQRSGATTKEGIYLGAFGVLENVKAQRPANLVREVEPVFGNQFDSDRTILPLVHLTGLANLVSDVDKLLENSFVYLGDNPSQDCALDLKSRKVVMNPRTVANNQGFVHAPSPEHADAAAILRAGWESRNAEGNAPTTLAVRLNSPRVRSALALLEGIGQGDSLSSLLGYQLERMLHDRHLDTLIFKLRRRFPLKTDQATSSFAATIDGMAAINARSIPAVWEGLGIPASDKAALLVLLDQLHAQFDAFGDLMLTESVFQTVKDSPARAAAALRTLNGSGQLHQPEVVRTPLTGSLVMFRTGVVFPRNNFLARWGPTVTPRATVSPQLNNWLASQLPDPRKVIMNATTGEVAENLTLAELDVQPLDLLAMFPEQNVVASENNQLAWLAQSVFRKKLSVPASATVKIDFTNRTTETPDELTIFELTPLVHNLRTLLTAARLLTADDFLREGVQGAVPVFNTRDTERALAKIVRDERLPENLANRILAARSDLESKLQVNAAIEVLQTAWTALLEVLAQGSRWSSQNLSLEISWAFDESQAQLLLNTADHAAAEFQRMQADADALINQLTTPQATDKFSICEQLGERLYGNAFRISPSVQLTNVPVVVLARTTDLSKNFDPQSLENWQCHSALVHPVFRTYRQCVLLRDALAAPGADRLLTIIQFNSPTAPAGFWVGAEMRGTDPRDDVSQNFGGTLSLALELPNNWNPQQAFAGFVFDEWTEVLPAREMATGVSFHFNQPDTEPAQVMLLAVCPAEGENWRWEYLTETISETFDRARKRLVSFEHLKTNPALAHLLPALVAPLERENLSPTLDLGRNEVDVELDANGGAPFVSL